MEEYKYYLNWYSRHGITYQPDLNCLLKEPLIDLVIHLRNLILAIKTINRCLDLTPNAFFLKTPESHPLPTSQAIIDKGEKLNQWLKLNQEVLQARDVLIVGAYLLEANTEESDSDSFDLPLGDASFHGLQTAQEVIDKAKVFGAWLQSHRELLDQMTVLTLDNFPPKNISSLPCEVCELGSLQKLEVNNEFLRTLPEKISQLTNLQTLNICRNELSSLPEGLGSLYHLTQLLLRSNKLTSLPDCIGRLSQLTELDLDSNRLRALPETIGELRQLVSLKLNNNRLATLPKTIGKMSRLQKLYLKENRITSLGEELCDLSNLKVLELEKNQLTTLPDHMGLLTHLETLNIYDNQLKSLPSGLSELITLRSLYVSKNELSSLPKGSGKVFQLSLRYGFLNVLSLDLDDNCFTRLPDEICDLVSYGEFKYFP